MTTTKRNKIIYWIATIWLALGMVSTGLVQLLRVKEEVEVVTNKLGYPVYFLTILGIWKILGTVAVLIPKFAVVKEWAYAGFFFAMTGAIFSHVAMGSSFGEIAPPLLLLALTVLSWYFRPADRKTVSVNQQN
jgi:uncharacterized membrane protein